ncbi:MAG: 50S ribosomal protein L32 [Candidatus Komeilibacteria bacterium]|nr:50S ribosomal protein L32 [Candidatus Komeilibacteria bacterium]
MGTPTKKRTSGQRKRRAAHFALANQNTVRCPKCKHVTLPHRACSFCGYYRGRQVLKMDRAIRRTEKIQS